MKNKTVPTIMMIISVILIATGLFLGYTQNQKKLELIKSIVTLKDEVFDKLTIEKEQIQKQNITGTISLQLPSIATIRQTEEANQMLNILRNLSTLSISYTYNKDLIDRRMSLVVNPSVNNEIPTNIVFYNDENDEGYIYLNNVYDKYIDLGKTELFSAMEEDDSEDISYIFTKIKESFTNSIGDKDILKEKTTIVIDEKEEKISKLSIKYDNMKLTEQVNKIIDALNNDERSAKILASKNITINKEEINTILQNVTEIEYIIYRNKDKVLKYELNITNTESIKESLIYINKKTPELILSENDKVIIKVQIESTDKVLNMTFLDENNQKIGTYSKDEKSTNLDLTYEQTNYSVIGTKENNKFNTTITMSTVANNIKQPVAIITLNGTISENVDFSNINISNKIEVDAITEQEQQQIKTNLMTIFTKLFT